MFKWGAVGIGLIALATSAYAQVDYGPVTGWGAFTVGQSTSSNEPVKRISAGSQVVYGLREDGSYFVQGNDQTNLTGFPLGGADAAQISVGNGFTVILNTSGRAVAFGTNDSGQATVPTSLPNLKYVSAGDKTVLAVTTGGTVTGWGSTVDGILTPPTGLNHVVKVATGSFHGVALKDDGTVVAWGDDSFHQTEVPAGLTGVVDIAVGTDHTAALKSDGTVVAWGDTYANECNIPASAQPYVRIAAGRGMTAMLTLDGRIVGTAGGVLHPFAFLRYIDVGVTNDGDIYGLLNNGEFVHGFGNAYTVPVIPPTGWRDAVQEFGYFTLHANGTVTNDGPVLYSGVAAITKSNGLLFANGDAVDQGVNLSGIKQVDYLTALRNDGTVFYAGPIGPGPLTNIVQICGAFAGQSSSAPPSPGGAARSATGTITVWGDNQAGQVTGIPSGLGILTDISYNYSTVATVNTLGQVSAWGLNNFGQTNVPAGLSGVIKVNTGNTSVLALKSDGSLVQWGGVINDYFGTVGAPSVPIPARCFGGAQINSTTNQALRTINVSTNWDAFHNGMSTSFTGTVTLTNVSATDTAVTLASTDPGVGVPATVIVPAGQHQVTFPITMAVTSDGSYSVVASSSGFNAAASFLVRVDDIDFKAAIAYASSVVSGSDDTIQVQFTHPTTHPMPLHISTTANLIAPLTVDVPVGATVVTFKIASLPVAATSTQTVTIKGSLGRATSAQVTLLNTSIASALFPASVKAGTPDTLQVTLNHPAPPAGVTVKVVASGASTSTGTITIAGGQSKGTIQLVTIDSSTYPYAPISAVATLGTQQVTATGHVLPDEPNAFLYSSQVVGGHGTTLVVQIPAAAPAGGKVVFLFSNYSQASGLTLGMPTQTTIPAGATSTTVPLTTTPVSANTTVSIFASPAGNSRSTPTIQLLVTAPRVTAVSLSPSSVTGGAHSTGTVTISDPAPAGGLVIQLTEKDSTAVTLPSATVTIPAGATTATFDVATTSVTTTQTARIGATVNGAGVQATLTVTP